MAKKNEKEKASEKTIKVNQQKWGKHVWDGGWVGIPSVVLTHQERFGLDAVDLNIIMHLAKHWWDPKKLPYPTKGSIARSMKISRSTVQRRIRNMENVGLIKRHKQFSESTGGQRANQYDLKGLIEKAKEFASEELEEQRKNQEKQTERRRPRASRNRSTKGASSG